MAFRATFSSILVICFALSAGTVRKESFRSTVLDTVVTYNVYLPSNYAQRVAAGERFPVVYLLHGCNGYPDLWHLGFPGTNNPMVTTGIDQVGLITVAPYDMSGVSWWVDSPLRPAWKLATYLTTELKKRIDSTLATRPERKYTGICGVSMGGFGAFHNALNRPDLYSAVFGIVPAVKIQSYPDNWGLPDVFGRQSQYIENWRRHDILPNACSFAGKNLKIQFYTNRNDIFRDDNQQLHDAFTTCGVDHHFTLYPTGGHDLPDSTTMLTVLRYFDDHFSGVGAVAFRSSFSPGVSTRTTRALFIGKGIPMPGVRIVDKNGSVFRPDGVKVGAGARSSR